MTSVVKFISYNLILLVSGCLIACARDKHETFKSTAAMTTPSTTPNDTATLGAGCFWCVEAVFSELKGVISVMPGYSGGSKENPSYEDVCSGNTGHAEVCQVVFNPAEISYSEILEVYWKTHDPTTLNSQGEDKGTQYRSVIFYHNPQQKETAEYYKRKLNESKAWDKPVITGIVPFVKFYPAENYHRNYYSLNPSQPYCTYVIQPKLEKFRAVFGNKLKMKK